MLTGHDGASNIAYDETGTISCYDRTSLPIVRQKMARIGYEPRRGTIKYRCPARDADRACDLCRAAGCRTAKGRGARETPVRANPEGPDPTTGGLTDRKRHRFSRMGSFTLRRDARLVVGPVPLPPFIASRPGLPLFSVESPASGESLFVVTAQTA